MTLEELGHLVQGREIDTVMVAVPDLRGRLMGKNLDAHHFLTKLPGGPEMCAYILATDVDMNPLDGFELAGWHTGYGDLRVVPDLGTIRRLNYLPGTVLVHGNAVHPDGRPVAVAPREILRSQLRALAVHGLQARVGIESEFVLYKGTEAQLRRSGFRNPTPVSPDNLDYALDRPPALNAFFHDLHNALHEAGAPIEAIKTEGAPGQIEVAWPYGHPVGACDTYTLHKHAVRHIAAQHRLTPTFMAAPQTGTGSGLHLHISLWRDDEAAFAMRPREELPELLQHSIAGLIDALPQLVPLYAPTPNSYKRYVRHSFAPPTTPGDATTAPAPSASQATTPAHTWKYACREPTPTPTSHSPRPSRPSSTASTTIPSSPSPAPATPTTLPTRSPCHATSKKPSPTSNKAASHCAHSAHP
ncbi:hypothetical protein SAV14893_094090 [Streptomyces avermitilis]|uniref:GS catalytic domain-containing protein n=2 Tax=Streptomyces avermitilis TaxID=33903 RepID=A0A4D4MDX3_STRAX|nr:hypothetical protein SAV14893_094090 [Streptomyces avermitilis]